MSVATLIDEIEAELKEEDFGRCTGLPEAAHSDPLFFLTTRYGEALLCDWAYLRRRLREVADGDAGMSDVYTQLFMYFPQRSAIQVHVKLYNGVASLHAGAIPIWSTAL